MASASARDSSPGVFFEQALNLEGGGGESRDGGGRYVERGDGGGRAALRDELADALDAFGGGIHAESARDFRVALGARGC